MTERTDPVAAEHVALPVGDVLPSAPRGTKAGSTEALKSLHADLTAAYRQYLEMAKVKPGILNASMLALIQQFLKHNDITAEAPQKDERGELQARLDQRRRSRELEGGTQNRVTLNQANRTGMQ